MPPAVTSPARLWRIQTFVRRQWSAWAFGRPGATFNRKRLIGSWSAGLHFFDFGRRATTRAALATRTTLMGATPDRSPDLDQFRRRFLGCCGVGRSRRSDLMGPAEMLAPRDWNLRGLWNRARGKWGGFDTEPVCLGELGADGRRRLQRLLEGRKISRHFLRP
jgi:hypothetical protein